MKTQNSFSTVKPPVAIPITREQLRAFGFSDAQIDAGEVRGHLETRGQWALPMRYTALCTSSRWDESKGYTCVASVTVFGVRTLTNCRQSGHCLEGQVSVMGRKVRGFTSSQLFELPDGKLIDIATIHACIK